MGRSARGLVVLVAVALCLLPLAASADAAGGRRFSGANRFETAVLANREVHPTAGVVVLARGDDYPDALAGTYYASFIDSPLVFTYPDSVPPETMEYHP